jgi:hypothetical protein
MPNPAVNSDVPVKVVVLVDLSRSTPVTWFCWATRNSDAYAAPRM